LRLGAKPFESELQGSWMRLAAGYIFTIDARLEVRPQLKLAQLLPDAAAASTGHNA
jgi:hypothetical protein